MIFKRQFFQTVITSESHKQKRTNEE